MILRWRVEYWVVHSRIHAWNEYFLDQRPKSWDKNFYIWWPEEVWEMIFVYLNSFFFVKNSNTDNYQWWADVIAVKVIIIVLNWFQMMTWLLYFFVILLMLIILVISSESYDAVRFHARFLLYYLISSTIAVLSLPYIALRPKDVKNCL